MGHLGIVAALAIGMAPIGAKAALLELDVEAAPVFEGTFEGGYDGDEFAGFVYEGDVPVGSLNGQVLNGGGVGGTGGAFFLYGLSPTVEATTFADFGWTFGSDAEEDTLEFLFEDAAGDLGGRVLVTLSGEFGADADAFFANGFAGVSAVRVVPVSPAVIPLPAPGLLLGGALAALALGRRQRA